MLQFTKYFILLFLFTATGSFAQNTAINTGINTKNPGSRLTVNGSVAGDYKIITGNAVLGYTDYYAAYNGNADAMLHLPPAGWGSLKGRVYAIKNTSNYMLTVIAPAQETISGTANMSSVTVPPGYYAKLISRGTVTGSTWELLAIMDGKATSVTVKKALDYSFGMDIGGYPISPTGFTVADNNPMFLPESQTMFTMPVAKPVFLNVAIGLADYTYPRVFSKSPYYRCDLVIDGVVVSYLFQIAQQQYVGSSLRFNISGVLNLSAGPHGIWVNITRWNDDGHTGNQRLMVLSVVYDGVYLD
ncbi:hypothetical protein [Flavobacterium lindanitolerans]|uniref:Uncharacterized protein n=1 Tax=Flavobacterium lindanitolerans TaxID=428988 RepID=A0A497UJW4_9FLAO|nr:hypothetical protein [Flavobacterium lindanitolerans]PKW21145.1 hypothetical protein B0G92_2429 [Flavobacterium lindanitolerans]RLJ30217.1 hypothetical protein CLV50_1621 [Flavobacterium lindanitolerans]